VALIVSTIGLCAILTSRLQLRTTTRQQNWHYARCLASSAIEVALVEIHTNSNWRTDYQNDVEYPATPFPADSGTFTWKLVDVDGSLSDDPNDSVRVYGMGRVGQRVCTKSVLIQASGQPLTCLEASLCVGNSVDFNGATVTGNRFASSNNSITATSSNINLSVEAVNTVSGGTYNAATQTGIAPRQMPDSTSVFDYYVANGTYIDYGSLDSDTGGARQMNRRVLSPAINPFGAGQTNPEGIYVIDCGGNRFRCQFSRIVGTLVLLNAGADSGFFNSVFLEPATPNFPTLLVQGSFRFDHDSATPLDEYWAGRNFNPPGTPYEGQEDTDQDDSYPSMVKGLAYVSGDVLPNTAGSLAFDGVLVVGNQIECRDLFDLTYDSTFLNDPPPGFRSGDEMEVQRRSWFRGSGN
jgi:hypothetical protein